MVEDRRLALHEEWMRKLASRMLEQFPTVRRWEETDDVLQEASLRLHKALESTEVLTELHYHRLAALQIRRVLLDLSKRYRAQGNSLAHHETLHGDEISELPATPPANSSSLTLDDWTAFHETVQELPGPEKEMFDLLWYSDLTQEKASELLGINVRTIQRRWRDARLRLYNQLTELGRQPIPLNRQSNSIQH